MPSVAPTIRRGCVCWRFIRLVRIGLGRQTPVVVHNHKIAGEKLDAIVDDHLRALPCEPIGQAAHTGHTECDQFGRGDLQSGNY